MPRAFSVVRFARRSTALVVIACMLAVPPPAHAQIEIVPVAASGDRAPGTETGVVFSSGNFIDVQLAHDGTVLFGGGLSGPSVSNQNDEGLWMGKPGDLALAIRTGDAAPELGDDAEFAFLGRPVLGPHQSAAFYARVRGAGISEDGLTPGNDDTLWTLEPAASVASAARNTATGSGGRINRARVHPLAQSSKLLAALIEFYFEFKDVAPIIPFFSLSPLVVVIWVVSLLVGGAAMEQGEARGDEGTAERGIVRMDETGERELLGRTGASAPGLTEELQSIVPSSVVAAGEHVAFAGTVGSGPAIWLGTHGALAPVVVRGGAIPDSAAAELGEDATFTTASGSLSLNRAGEIAFVSGYAVGSVAGGDALFAGDPDALRLVGRTVQGGSSDEGFTSFSEMVMNGAADVAFVASHTTLGEPGVVRGLWATVAHADPQLLLAEGRTAPGLEGGEVVTFLEEGPFMNASGQVAMRAGIGPAAGVQNTVDRGVWLFDPEDGVQLVARSGATMDAGDGEPVVLDNVSYITSHADLRSGGEDGRATVLNDLGQLVFQAHWRQQSGPFRSGVFIAAGACDVETCRDLDAACKRCAQPVSQGSDPAASDALAVLRVAVGVASCAACVCDVDGSGAVSAVDALVTLKRAVGQDVDVFCPAV
jgi:hypothetical protein